MSDVQKINAELWEPMPRSAVKHDSQRGLDYADYFYVVNELNRIFGATRWHHEIVDHGEAMDLLAETDSEGRVRRYVAGWRTRVRIVFADFPELHKEDIGFGRGFGKYAVDAQESAQKESVTDAIKRAARHLGPRFNALYDKEQSMVRDPDLEPGLVWIGPHRGKPIAKASMAFLKSYFETVKEERPEASEHFEAIAARIAELEQEETDSIAKAVKKGKAA